MCTVYLLLGSPLIHNIEAAGVELQGVWNGRDLANLACAFA